MFLDKAAGSANNQGVIGESKPPGFFDPGLIVSFCYLPPGFFFNLLPKFRQFFLTGVIHVPCFLKNVPRSILADGEPVIDLVDGAIASSGSYRGDEPSFLKEVQRSFSLLHAITCFPAQGF